jgi:hypothetical protein
MTKFYGMYKLEWIDPSNNKSVISHLIVMDNLFKAFDVGIRFDLKGSFANRTRLKEEETMYGNRDITVAMKDNDFREHMKKIEIVECLKTNMPPLKVVL